MTDTMTDTLMARIPAPYRLRRTAAADAEAVVGLIADCDIAINGEAARYTSEDILNDIAGIDGETVAWVLEGPDAAVVGYATTTNGGAGRVFSDCYVHPTHRGHGLTGALVRLTEARAHGFIAAAPEGARVTLGTGIYLKDAKARAVLEDEGYALVRVHWGMRIDLDAPPPAPEWPASVTVRPFVPDQDERAVFDCAEEAFSDHWGHTPGKFEQWIKRTERSDFDPSLWLLAEEGGQLAGIALCRQRPETGWVGTLAVRRPWRKRGLGMALLRYAFGEFYRRGERRVGLGVDAQSLTGATRLYERAGMRPVEEIAIYEKELRPGTDLRTLALTE